MKSICLLSFAAYLFCGSAQAELSLMGCGPPYGGLSYVINKGITAVEVAKKFENLPWARERYDAIEYIDGQPSNRSASFHARLRTSKKYSYGGGSWQIDVPVGTEEFLAQKLRETGMVSRVALPYADCGGAEVAYFSLGKLKDQLALKIPANFQNFIADAAQKYIRSRSIGGLSEVGAAEVKNFTAVPIPPNLPVGRVRFRVASEISRDRSTNSTWDEFDAVFMIWKLEERESLVSVSVERYKNAPRAGRSTPPSSDHFKEPQGEDSWDDEMVISSSIAAYFSKVFKGECVVDGEGFGDGDDGEPFKCKRTFEVVR